MTDLRTRIAAAIEAEQAAWDGGDRHYGAAPPDDLADAVIQALGLRIEYGALDHTDSGRLSDDDDLTPLQGETLKTRYITDWKPHA